MLGKTTFCTICCSRVGSLNTLSFCFLPTTLVRNRSDVTTRPSNLAAFAGERHGVVVSQGGCTRDALLCVPWGGSGARQQRPDLADKSREVRRELGLVLVRIPACRTKPHAVMLCLFSTAGHGVQTHKLTFSTMAA